MKELTPERLDAIAQAINANRKIDAIKLYREATGADLKTAKTEIDKIADTVATTRIASDDPGGAAADDGRQTFTGMSARQDRKANRSLLWVGLLTAAFILVIVLRVLLR